MFRNQLIVTFLAIFLLNSCYSKSIRDDKYFYLFVSNSNATQVPEKTTVRVPQNSTTAAPEVTTRVPQNSTTVASETTTTKPVTSSQTGTTYDWGQWTKTQAPGSRTTYDWGQHTATGSTYDWGQHTATGSTYDWGQHTATGSTYDWGQHTNTGSKTTYDWGQWTKTQAPGSRTTYDWGQHTATGSTYDWGQHTATATTYNWGQHTNTGSRTTYDWGQWTKTTSPGSQTTYDWGQHTSTSNPNETTTENPNDNDNHYKCPAGKYTCKGTIGLCISLNQICDGKQDCPHRDDEDTKVCFPGFGGSKIKAKHTNNFAGTGFMWNIRNIVVKDRSEANLFDQQSNNKNSELVMSNNSNDESN